MNDKRDEDNYGKPLTTSWSAADKSTVLLEARAFNETPLNPTKCRQIIAKLILLIYRAAPLSQIEATDIFFSITKLFMNNSIPLRQIIYLAIKELAPIASDILMVTSSLTKDMNAKADIIYRPNAIRALCRITDASLIQGIERFIKQAIVDKIPSVSSAAIVCSFHLYTLNKEVVKRWVNEVQEAINSKGAITQYHAVGLLYLIKQNDKMGIIKLIQNCHKMNLKSPHANCMLIRYICKVIDEEPSSNEASAMHSMLESFLRHKSDIVVFEAAKGICLLKNSPKIALAVATLQTMLVSHKPCMRFAAIRSLNQLAMTRSTDVFPCNMDIENLIADPNRSIATFSITTLLKTGTEASIDRLMKQISGFMSEITDEFKIIVIDAVRTLCLKFPNKHTGILAFIADNLMEEGGYTFKKAVVEALFDIIHDIPEAVEDALGHLCEFIEDCEYTKLAVRILHMIGMVGPRTAKPVIYVRYIYNRVILENATVRAAAVSALAKFAVSTVDLRDRIQILLQRCLEDVDDEVRDRAAMYLKIINEKELSQKYITDEVNLVKYLASVEAQSNPFDLSLVPTVSRAEIQSEHLQMKIKAQDAIASVPSPKKADALPLITSDLNYSKVIGSIPSLAVLGSILKSSQPVELTENDVEYVVSCVKHIFTQNIVFQFNIRNTLQNTRLKNITVQMKEDTDEIPMKPTFTLPLLKCDYDSTGACYVIFDKTDFPITSFTNTLKFTMLEVEEDIQVDDGYEDEYMIEDIDLLVGDYIQPLYGDWSRLWADLEHEFIETYSLSAVSTLQAATDQIVNALCMNVHEDGSMVPSKSMTHSVLLSGLFIGGFKTCVKCRMAIDEGNGVTLEVRVKSSNYDVAELVANSIY